MGAYSVEVKASLFHAVFKFSQFNRDNLRGAAFLWCLTVFTALRRYNVKVFVKADETNNRISLQSQGAS